VGGLEDSVVDLSEAQGTGIKFREYSSHALWLALERALELYGAPRRLAEVRRRGMGVDVSWKQAAGRYVALYESLQAARELPRQREAK
jgi:starch synthase